ncbi:hypothetical protein PFLUV_G00220390 [Perca fluviatilis]|uniref:Uncharacterized protein n=1 Tax=Perca fluviatilis TaxID=8168 RepID=A0A6A5DRB7_PERFL|nr:hypothetical protein PFLUV_G00220390 [Perca fluviatilis]
MVQRTLGPTYRLLLLSLTAEKMKARIVFLLFALVAVLQAMPTVPHKDRLVVPEEVALQDIVEADLTDLRPATTTMKSPRISKER